MAGAFGFYVKALSFSVIDGFIQMKCVADWLQTLSIRIDLRCIFTGCPKIKKTCRMLLSSKPNTMMSK